MKRTTPSQDRLERIIGESIKQLDDGIQYHFRRWMQFLRRQKDWNEMHRSLLNIGRVILRYEGTPIGTIDYHYYCCARVIYEEAATMIDQQSSFWHGMPISDFLDVIESSVQVRMKETIQHIKQNHLP